KRGETLVVAGDERIVWAQAISAALEQGERFLATGASPGVAVAGAQAVAVEHPDATVLVLRRMDDAFAARLSERAGLQIRIVDYGSREPGAGPFGVLNSDALARGDAVAAFVPEESAYAASVPIQASTGETVAMLHALLPAAEVM